MAEVTFIKKGGVGKKEDRDKEKVGGGEVGFFKYEKMYKELSCCLHKL